jgi:hypothetical protein
LGETSPFCGKVWDQCQIKHNITLAGFGDDTNCTLRKCLDPGCEEVGIPYGKRPLYAMLLAYANFWMRWVYTALTALRMFGKGLFLKSDDAFFLNPWCLADLLVVIAAWFTTPFPFGNLMFFMVLRGAKVIVNSQSPWLWVFRVQMSALGQGLYKIFMVFVFMNFILAFVSLLAISLLGAKGDFHNRCAVPVFKNEGGNISFTYEPLVPERPCRMNHLYELDTSRCFSDVWASEKKNFTPSSQSDTKGLQQPGCQGTCGAISFYQSNILGTEYILKVEGVDNFDSPMKADGVFCIGPDFVPLDTAQFPPSPSGVQGGDMKDYKHANLTNWPTVGNNDLRNFDDFGHAAIVLYTIFFRNGWTGPVFPAFAVGGHGVIIAWIVIMIFVSYYLLNITVSITCAYYSEATEQEKQAAAKRLEDEKPPVFGDDDEEDKGDEEDDDEEVSGPKSTRDALLEELKNEEYPWCGRGCDLCTLIGKGLTTVRDKIAGVIQAKQPVIYKILKIPCSAVQSVCGSSFKTCCHSLIKCSIYLVFPAFREQKKGDSEDDDAGEEAAPPVLGNSYMSYISVVCMFGCMITQGLQFAQTPLYKCACTDAQIRQMENYDSLVDCSPLGFCLAEFGNPNGTILNKNQTCVSGKCLSKSFQGYACYNPRFNRVIHAANITRGLSQPAAEAWMAERANWCSWGQYLHFALYGWLLIFLLELCARYLAHQGMVNFFTNNLDPPDASERDRERSLLDKLRILNFRNIVDTFCILATCAGIFITEFRLPQPFSLATIMDVQLLLAGVSFSDPFGDETGVRWDLKLLRLATIIRLSIRTGAIAKIPAVAVILRGFRGAEKVTLGFLMLLAVVFFGALTGKELFDHGYSYMRQRFEGSSNFKDLTSSMLPMLTIMTGSKWYDYAKAGTNSIGVAGFVFFTLYFFIVFFQFQRIFIAIIVQNYELEETEKHEAQKLLLNMKFERIQYETEKSEKEFFANSGSKGAYDNFSFTKNYEKLLRGAKVTLRDLMDYTEHLASGGRGFSMANENALIGEEMTFLDEQQENQGEEEDEVEKALKLKTKIQRELSINPHSKKAKAEDDPPPVPIARRISAAARELVDNNQYFVGVLLVVILASVFFAVYPGIDEDTGINGLGNILSLAFLGFFLAEMVLKMIGYGLYGVHAETRVTGYFSRAWCCVDFLLVVAQAFDVLTALFPEMINLGENDGFLRGFRAIRALRVLVAVKKIDKDRNPLTMVMAALGASIPSIFTLLIAVIFVMFIFALVGMDQYSGLLSRCVTEDELDSTGTKCRVDSQCSPGYVGQCPYKGIGTYSYCIMDKVHCFGNKEKIPVAFLNTKWRSLEAREFRILVPREWKKTKLDFDNIYSAIYSVFSLINKSEFEDMLLQLLSITQRDKAPVKNSQPLNAIYLFSLVLVLGIFVSQIVIGMIMTNLRLKSGLAFHTKDQLVWPATQQAIKLLESSYSPFAARAGGEEPPEGHPIWIVLLKIRAKFRGIRDHWRWDYLISLTVIFNCVLLGTYYFDQTGPREQVYFWGGFACFILYCLEFVINMIADAQSYISAPRNQFDVGLTALTAIDLFVLPTYGLDLGLASLRMFRLLKLLYKSETFVRLMETISFSAPEAMATVILTFVVIFVFAALATNMFRDIKEGKGVSDQSNVPTDFRDFINALISLFQLSTGDGWGQFIDDAAIKAPHCTPKLWRPVDLNATKTSSALAKERQEMFLSLGAWKQADLHGNTAIPSDCGQEIASYAVFLLFIFINNYIILPTFIASIIASYFSANLRDHALLNDADLKKYQESWIDMNPDGNPLLGKSYFTFKKIGDRAPKAEQPWDFSKFHSLTEMLMMKRCMLGFSKNNDPMKYKMAIQRLKHRAGNAKKFTVDYKTMCVLLLSIAEKARPVTIVDKLRREKVSDSPCTPLSLFPGVC